MINKSLPGTVREPKLLWRTWGISSPGRSGWVGSWAFQGWLKKEEIYQTIKWNINFVLELPMTFLPATTCDIPLAAAVLDLQALSPFSSLKSTPSISSVWRMKGMLTALAETTATSGTNLWKCRTSQSQKEDKKILRSNYLKNGRSSRFENLFQTQGRDQSRGGCADVSSS